MIRLVLAAALLLPTLAMAQQPRQYQPTSLVLLQQSLECENVASSQYSQSQSKIAELTKQVEELTKERDKAAKPEPAK